MQHGCCHFNVCFAQSKGHCFLMLLLMKMLNFSSFFHLMRAVSVAGKYSIFNRSLKLCLESCGDVHACATKGCNLHSGE